LIVSKNGTDLKKKIDGLNLKDCNRIAGAQNQVACGNNTSII
jgi:hypothetical protein